MFMHNFCSCYIKTNLTLYMYLSWDKFKIRTLKKYRFLSKMKLRPPIQTVWVAELPGLNAYALREEQNGCLASAPKKKGKNSFSAIVGFFF